MNSRRIGVIFIKVNYFTERTGQRRVLCTFKKFPSNHLLAQLSPTLRANAQTRYTLHTSRAGRHAHQSDCLCSFVNQ